MAQNLRIHTLKAFARVTASSTGAFQILCLLCVQITFPLIAGSGSEPKYVNLHNCSFSVLSKSLHR